MTLSLSVVVPAFDEADNIAALVEAIEAVRTSLPGSFELILVDDASRDATWQRIVDAAATRPWLRGIRLLANRGQTAAMMAGLAAARGGFIAFLDADLQNDPADIPRLLEPILKGEADVACGWRRDRQDDLFLRRLPSRIANSMVRRVFRLPIHDLGCTLKVFRRPFIENVRLCGEMHRFIVVYAQAEGARLVEMPVFHRPRSAGSSKYGLERVGKVLVDLLTVKLLNSYGATPAYFFGKIALMFAMLGTIAFGIVAWRTFVLDNPQSTPMIFMMLLAYVAALICFMSGLLAELIVRALPAGGAPWFRVVEEVNGGDLKSSSDTDRSS